MLGFEGRRERNMKKLKDTILGILENPYVSFRKNYGGCASKGIMPDLQPEAWLLVDAPNASQS